MQIHWNCFIKMHLGAFATRMLLGFYKYYAKIAFLFFCSSVKKERDPSDATLCQDDIVRVRRFLKTKRIKFKRYMKKTYVSPLMVEVNVEAESMLAASMKMDGNKTVDTSNGGQLGKENDRQWGNLWN